MRPEKRILLEDVLGDTRREATLLAGRRILRRRRWKRATTRVFGVFAVLALVALAARESRLKQPVPSARQPGLVVSGPPKVRVEYLTDDELLALFPNTPVGLISTADGRKRLIFPHPGDEAKFISRL